MKCFLNFLFSFCFLALLSFCSLSIVNDTYAVEDVTYTMDSSNNSSSWVYLCSNSGTGGASSCSSYKYLSISFSIDGTLNTPDFRVDYYITQGGQGNSWSIVPYFVSSSFFSLYTPTNVRVRVYNQSLVSADLDWSVDFVLSENNPYSSGIIPSGSLSITENGTYDVTNYAEAVVDVPTSSAGGGGNYHDDLVTINNSILTCGAILLVLYFFYCIYRMIIKPLRS